MVARGYRISLVVFNLISHLFSALTWDTVVYQVKHEKRNSISISNYYYSVYYINILMTTFWQLFKDLQTLLKISKDSPKVVWSPDNCFQTFSKNFWRLPKISEANWRLLRKKRWCFDFTGTHLSTFQEIMEPYSNADLFTSENNILFSCVKISCLRAKAHLVFQWC